jgi:replication factor C subunit 3/5
MLWVDKHRPKDLQEVDLHPGVTDTLSKLAKSDDFPHLLVHGPSGSGKKTRVMALLKAHYGDSALNIRLEHKTVSVTDSKSIDIATLSSPHHIDINPSDAGVYDRVIVMQMIREIAETVPLITSTTSGPSLAGSRTANIKRNFKVVVLNEVDKMSRPAQQALRRTMEKYVATCRLILICNSPSRLIAPLRSRCLAIRIAAHGKPAILSAINQVVAKEKLPPPSTSFTNVIDARCEGNLRRALLMLEAAKMAKCDFSGSGEDIPVPDWKVYVREIAADVFHEQTPRKLYEIRQKYYELLTQCLPAELVLKEVTKELIAAAPSVNLQREIIRQAAQYDHYLKLGSKPIMHLEAFTAQVMKCLKS